MQPGSDKEMTLQEFIDHFEKERKLEITRICQGVTTLHPWGDYVGPLFIPQAKQDEIEHENDVKRRLDMSEDSIANTSPPCQTTTESDENISLLETQMNLTTHSLHHEPVSKLKIPKGRSKPAERMTYTEKAMNNLGSPALTMRR